ncbi:MAG: methyltransferase [Robiginitomaculum sp.]|nr:methyltransferase [Robiginitomaculum sp.]
MIKYSLPVIASLALFACNSEPVAKEDVSEAATPEVVASGPDMKLLQSNVSGDWRTDDAKARDVFRNPAATLEFCGVDPSSNISEIWPGGGWYSQILVPWVNANGGKFNAVILDPEISEGMANLLQRYLAQFEDKDLFGEIDYAPLSATSAGFADENSQDAVLTFRNVHSWMSRGIAEKAFDDFYASLKPGGVLCVIEHRLPSSAVQSAKAGNGYVQEAMVKALAEEAGFEFEAASEINANAKDTADHPYGVWTLPPSKRSPRNDEEKAEYPDFDRAAFDAIGESDRMTLRFKKPVTPEASGE